MRELETADRERESEEVGQTDGNTLVPYHAPRRRRRVLASPTRGAPREEYKNWVAARPVPEDTGHLGPHMTQMEQEDARRWCGIPKRVGEARPSD